MTSWLLKTEPSTYSWSDLVRDGKTVWDGVTNAAALIHLRAMQTGDEALIYHSGDERAIVGIARITRGGHPDPGLDDPKRAVVDLKPVRALKVTGDVGGNQGRKEARRPRPGPDQPAFLHAGERGTPGGAAENGSEVRGET